jgi:hypothetical protein
MDREIVVLLLYLAGSLCFLGGSTVALMERMTR